MKMIRCSEEQWVDRRAIAGAVLHVHPKKGKTLTLTFRADMGLPMQFCDLQDGYLTSAVRDLELMTGDELFRWLNRGAKPTEE